MAGPKLGNSPALNLSKLYRHGTMREQRTLVAGGLMMPVGRAVAVAAIPSHAPDGVFMAALALALLDLFALGLTAASLEERAQSENVQAVIQLDEEARDKPGEPKLAWNFAKVMLESDLDRNLRQASSIYYLVLLIMLFGMGVI